jgi:hypothetical protein
MAEELVHRIEALPAGRTSAHHYAFASFYDRCDRGCGFYDRLGWQLLMRVGIVNSFAR